jgi:regulator of cell morphogenesis and NO signaling
MDDLAQSPIGNLVARHPATSRVFRRYKLDFCCGGGKTVADACAARGLDAAAVVEELRCVVEHGAGGGPDEEAAPDWMHEDLAALVRFVIERFHVPLREELERLRQMSHRVLAVHGERSPDLWPPLDRVLERVRVGLLDHMDCEESVLFPRVVQLRNLAAQAATAAATPPPAGPQLPLARPIESMEADHDRVGDDLRRIRELTADFTLPGEACNTVRALYDGLENLENEMHQHVHLENEILFPRALELERALFGRIAVS